MNEPKPFEEVKDCGDEFHKDKDLNYPSVLGGKKAKYCILCGGKLPDERN